MLKVVTWIVYFICMFALLILGSAGIIDSDIAIMGMLWLIFMLITNKEK